MTSFRQIEARANAVAGCARASDIVFPGRPAAEQGVEDHAQGYLSRRRQEASE
jgi:hypothetical protein